MSKILIVGGVAGGATAAARLRRLSEDDEIILFERDEYISFANCGLPYYIGDVITERQKLLVQTVEGMSKRFNLDIRNFSEVTAVNRETNTVQVINHQSGETYEESFTHLILSPGAKPIAPPIKGLAEADNIFTLRNIPDTDKIKVAVSHQKARRAVVIGGGFIGIEMAENLRELGLNVTVVEKLDQVFKPLDYEMAQLIHQELNANGVNLILGDGVDHFEAAGHSVVLESGMTLEADVVILSIGVVPENRLAKDAALKLGPRGHIVTTSTYQVLDGETEKPVKNIFAIGDAIEVKDFVSGSQTAVPLAWPANRQGRTVADHIYGKAFKNEGIQGTSVAKVFNLTMAATGSNAATLKARGVDFKEMHAHRGNHAGYYPGSSTIALKMVYDPKTLKILGAQAVGRDGTEKRIDVLATAMKMGATIYDLQDLELSYAPPFSAAKDPVNILGYMAQNMDEAVYGNAQWHEIDAILAQGGTLVDVRTPIEFSAGHVEGALNIPLDDLRDRLEELPQDKDAPLYLTCQVGLRGYLAICILKDHGYTNLYNLDGGFMTYKAGHYQLAPLNFDCEGGACDLKAEEAPHHGGEIRTVDVTGLQCPGPLMATYNAIKEVKEGEMVRTIATDCGFVKDVENWCRTNGHTLVSQETHGKEYISMIRKGRAEGASCCMTEATVPTQKNATMVVFNGDLDKAIAAMIIAQGAAAQGKDVTLFFTFWGLNILRKAQGPKVSKNAVEKMFGFMMPKGAKKLPLSKMNMLGVGPAMIKRIMKQKNVDDLDTMIAKAQATGVRFIACTMSMELMGIKKEELIDGIEYAGVGTYIASNENVGTTLFI